MTLQIPDEILKSAHLDEHAILVEFACHLYDLDRLSLGQAARMAGMERTAFEDELHDRGIAIYRYGPEEFQQDMQAIAKMNGTKIQE